MRQFLTIDDDRWLTRFGDKSAGSKSFGAETPDTGDGAYYSKVTAAVTGTFTAGVANIVDGTYNLPCVLIIMQSATGLPTDNWEFNYLISVSGGIGTFQYALQHTYSDFTSQIVTASPFSDIELTDVLSCPAWDGEKYGVGLLFGGDIINGVGSLNSVGLGFRGGVAAVRGEGTNLLYTDGTTANGDGSGGGGNATDSGHVEGGNSGGGGNRTAGQAGVARNTGTGGDAGLAVSTQDGKVAVMGGASGGGGHGYGGPAGQSGVAGSGIWITVAKRQEWTGGVAISGQNGTGASDRSASGASAPGVWIAKGSSIDVTGTIAATPGTGGTCTAAFGGKGGDSGEGVLHSDYGNTVMAGIDATHDEILSDTFAHEGIFHSTSAALAQEKYKHQVRIEAI